MKAMIYSAYAKNVPLNAKKVSIINSELIATVLSIISYSLIVSQNYVYGYFLGFIGSLVLSIIMYNKKLGLLVLLYTFFIVANFIGFYNSLQFNA